MVASHGVNYATPRGFGTKLRSGFKETLFPDDPFRQFKNENNSLLRIKRAIQYFIPIFYWLPNYNFGLFKYDVLAGLTITSLAIPQGISYARLASIPPIIGLYSSFVPPLIYAVFGSSKHLAVGTVAASSLLIASILHGKVSSQDDPTLFLHLVFTSCFFTGIFQSALGFLRLGLLVDFLAHSTITGFMGGTAVIICLQQLKGLFGLTHFTTKTDVVSVLHAVFSHTNEWKWESAVVGIVFLSFLQFTRYLSQRNPRLFWMSAMSPLVTVVIGCVFAYLIHGDKHGIPTVGDLKKGLNPISIQFLNFDPKYLSVTVQAGLISGMVALAEGIAIGRSFAIMRNETIDGNKEMIAFGFMNIIGSCTSCYLTTGPFSKTAVNFNAGCRTQMSNVVMAVFMMLVLLFLAPLFSHTPLVALSAIIMSAMFGLIKYDEAIHLFKVDKFDFLICMSAFFGVSFISMDIGIMMSVGLCILRALLYVARPPSCKLGKIPDTALYRDAAQYPGTVTIPGVLLLQLGSPLYYANGNYVRERVLRWIREEGEMIECLLLELSGVTAIDTTGIATLSELRKILGSKDIKMGIINPRLEVLEKMITSKFVDVIGKENIYLSIEDAVEASRFSLSKIEKQNSVNESN
ncbi:Sulfate transporter 3 5 isoform 1 [Tripterygium wilfordii]|uniref:Sulfate transporter 3 5 isoform 1 n=1 Tax=Tripterygium wilfordii TaxID=458696 RepID=A0A7J7D9A6_TRIWF|nr:probable sulfate transporter 3.5 [Tripterygium wilfordii]KAF5742955.1 Sulfate transporter 3 5 isoform 1 [Tripterygium wilfordii]